MARRFMSLCADYQKYFRMQRRDMGDHARHYLTGLLGRNVRKSIGRIGEELPESNYQGLQQFISDSPWDDRALLRQVRSEAEALLGRHRDTALYLDETSFVKKGNASVGVQRQYCGRLGKIENAPRWWTSACFCRKAGRTIPFAAKKPRCPPPNNGIKPKPNWPWPWCAPPGPKA
jgi:SRSO17 transposase